MGWQPRVEMEREYMAISFVPLNAAPAHEHEIHHKLSKISEIIELHPLFEEYDLIVKIKADSFENIFGGSFAVSPYALFFSSNKSITSLPTCFIKYSVFILIYFIDAKIIWYKNEH